MYHNKKLRRDFGGPFSAIFMQYFCRLTLTKHHASLVRTDARDRVLSLAAFPALLFLIFFLSFFFINKFLVPQQC